jgi:hypothetical protein
MSKMERPPPRPIRRLLVANRSDDNSLTLKYMSNPTVEARSRQGLSPRLENWISKHSPSMSPETRHML